MTGDAGFKIVHLVDMPQAAATLECWFIEEWKPWYGPAGCVVQGGDHHVPPGSGC